jgi:nucleoside-diphosphate-sugar epimerase
MRPKTVVVTGATGFVGGAIALELLAVTDVTVLCLTRADSQAAATRRLNDYLSKAAVLYGRPELLPAIESRVQAIPGDLEDPELPARMPSSGLDLLIHAAASLKFADRDAPELQRINVEGTRALVGFAERAGISRLVHVSTAYVAGRRTGVILENDPAPGEYYNEYERTKAEAEALVRASSVDTRIVRPSVVVGHRDTAATTSSTGYYAMLKVTSRLHRFMRMDGVPGRIRVLADPEQELNLIPVDMVAKAVVSIALAEGDQRVFHVTNAQAPMLTTAFDAAFRLLSLPTPEFTDDPESLSPLDKRLRNAFYDSYMNSAKIFDTTNTVDICGPDAMTYPMDTDDLNRYSGWFLDNVLAAPAGR